MQHNTPITPLSDMSWLGISYDLWSTAIAVIMVASSLVLATVLFLLVGSMDYHSMKPKAQKAFDYVFAVAAGIFTLCVLVAPFSFYATHTIQNDFSEQVTQIISEQGVDLSQGCIIGQNDVSSIQDCSDLFTNNDMKINFTTVANSQNYEAYITGDSLSLKKNAEN